MKHTKGKWQLGNGADTVVTVPSVRDPQDSVDFYGGDLIAESISNKADRYLISAAPDMAQALKELLEFFDDGVKTYQPHSSAEEEAIWNNARTALEKARIFSKPLSFADAMKAIEEGQDVVCFLNGEKITVTSYRGSVGSILYDTHGVSGGGASLKIAYMVAGRWMLKEDDE